MFGIGMSELIIILLICLVVFGAGKLPEISKNIAKGIKTFEKEMKDSDEKYAAGLFDEKRLAAPITDFGLFTFGNYETMSPFLLRFYFFA